MWFLKMEEKMYFKWFIAKYLKLYCGIIIILFFTLVNSLTVTQSGTGMSVTVQSTGEYSVTTSTPAWTFSGNCSKALSDVVQVNGTDNLGKFTGISFNLTSTGPLQGTIRLYEGLPVTMFSMKALAGMASLGVSFPNFTTYPKTNMYNMGQKNKKFSDPTFVLTEIGDNSPLVSFNTQGETFIYSAADHFWEVSNSYSGALRSLIKSWATPLPSGWDHQVILAVGKGVNHIFDVWGEGLRGYYGKKLPSNEAEIPLKTMGFWTDNFAYYYYKVDAQFRNYEEQLLAVKDYFKNTVKVPLGYMMLDSWWYKKGCNQSWRDFVGCYLYQVSPDVFPSGLNGFYKKMGVPMVTHHRWYEASCSPIAKKYGLSGGLPTKYDAWKEIVYGVGDSGVVTFEQDWLDANARVGQHIGDFDSAMGNMARACAEKKMTVQYCMAPPMNYMQAMKHQNVTTMRTTDDGYTQAHWNGHILNSRFCWSAGMFPWVDCFKSSDKGSVISAVVAANFFPPSEKMGNETVANILPATRKDGMLVHPDVPGLPTDNTLIDMARGVAANPVSVALTDHGNNVKTYYLWVPGANAQSYSFDPAVDGTASQSGYYAYHWFNKTGKVIATGDKLTATCSAGTGKFDYWIMAPVASCGIAFLGDLSKYASCGRSRVTSLSHSSKQVKATIDLEVLEASVTLSGYAKEKPIVICSDNATIGTVSFANNLFTVVLTPRSGSRTPMTVAIGADSSVGLMENHSEGHPFSVKISAFHGIIKADIGNSGDFMINVFSLNGKLVCSENCQNLKSWTSMGNQLQKGTYIVRITTTKTSHVQKCIVR
jgi:hypothetical protein